MPVIPVLLPQQVDSFGKMFDKTSPNGVLSGNQAKDIFSKARLPIQVLERIWSVVDQNAKGELTRPEFIVAMHLIQCFMNKSMTIMPTQIPDQMWQAAQGGYPPSQFTPPQLGSRMASNSTIGSTSSPTPILQQQLSGTVASNKTNLNTWIMSKQQKEQYGAIFETLDSTKRGTITGGEVANFLMTSKLPSADLANIWELANLDQSSDFTKQEFCIAMYLIQKKMAGYELPLETPVELIQSSALTVQEENLQPNPVPLPSHQSFASAKQASAPQRSASHMDDLLGIFKTAAPMSPANSQIPIAGANYGAPHSAVPPPAPASRHPTQMVAPPQQQNIMPVGTATTLTNENTQFVPSSNYGKNLMVDSSDDDDGPENLDIPRQRDAAFHNTAAVSPPAIPGRTNKPHFDSSDKLPLAPPQVPPHPQSNYDALKSLDNSQFSSFTSQPATGFSNAAMGTAAVVGGATAAAAAATAAAIGFTGAPAVRTAGDDVTNQLSNTSVEIANYSNQINSLSKQTSVVSSKKEKAQQELNKMLNTKETILGKLNQLKALHENETQQVLEVQNMMLEAKKEVDELNSELSVAEANYHAEQTQLEKLQLQYDESQKNSQTLKERLGTLNAESIDLKSQIEDFTNKSSQAKNLLAVTEQQIAVQESENHELKSKIEELKNSIFHIDTQHKQLLTRGSQIDEEQMNLHEAHTSASVSLAEKSVAFSVAAAAAASTGIHLAGLGDETENTDKVDGEEPEEVPTASLDDFDESEFTGANSAPTVANDAAAVLDEPAAAENTDIEISTPVQKQVDILSDASSPTGTNGMSNTAASETAATQTVDAESETEPNQQRFNLPFNIPHSETSSTQNNPSQSVRGDDLDVPDSESSTINDSQEPATETNGDGNVESFEMVNHSDATQSNTQLPESTTTEIDDDVTTDVLSTAVESRDQLVGEDAEEEKEELPAMAESSSTDEFEDAKLEPAEEEVNKEAPAAVSKNPFSSPSANGSSTAGLDDMFDDLGLEEAAVEEDDDNTAIGASAADLPAGTGFSFSESNPSVPAAAPVGGDDWEQVFAGFGNDPNLQPAAVENPQTQFNQQTTNFGGDFTNSFTGTTPQAAAQDVADGFTQAQKLAIEELKGMGFPEKESLDALEKCGWNIDDASNFLLDI